MQIESISPIIACSVYKINESPNISHQPEKANNNILNVEDKVTISAEASYLSKFYVAMNIPDDEPDEDPPD